LVLPPHGPEEYRKHWQVVVSKSSAQTSRPRPSRLRSSMMSSLTDGYATPAMYPIRQPSHRLAQAIIDKTPRATLVSGPRSNVAPDDRDRKSGPAERRTTTP